LALETATRPRLPSATRPETLLGDDLVARPAHVETPVEAVSYVGVGIVKTDMSKE
jgi:hypothetical protein